jgi:hypothetical protein
MRVVFDRPNDEPESLFSGSAWMRAAEDWASELGLSVWQWRVDQTFRVTRFGQPKSTPGTWHRIQWTGKEWEVKPCQ